MAIVFSIHWDTMSDDALSSKGTGEKSFAKYSASRSLYRNDLLVYVLSLWWRHQMETFSALLAICAGNSPVCGEFPAQRPLTRSFDAFFDLRMNERLSKHSWGWWLETTSRPLWRQSNVGFLLHSLLSTPSHLVGTFTACPSVNPPPRDMPT